MRAASVRNSGVAERLSPSRSTSMPAPFSIIPSSIIMGDAAGASAGAAAAGTPDGAVDAAGAGAAGWASFARAASLAADTIALNCSWDRPAGGCGGEGGDPCA